MPHNTSFPSLSCLRIISRLTGWSLFIRSGLRFYLLLLILIYYFYRYLDYPNYLTSYKEKYNHIATDCRYPRGFLFTVTTSFAPKAMMGCGKGAFSNFEIIIITGTGSDRTIISSSPGFGPNILLISFLARASTSFFNSCPLPSTDSIGVPRFIGSNTLYINWKVLLICDFRNLSSIDISSSKRLD
jgi:hypothetical protein